MNESPICFRLFKEELEITQYEISSITRIRIISQIFGFIIAILGALSLFFPNLLGESISIDNLSKFSSIFLGGLFFSSTHFFIKKDFKGLRIRKSELKIIIDDYKLFTKKTEEEQLMLVEECEQILRKRKGL